MTVERLMDIVRRVNADGHDRHPGRAERQPGHEPGRARLLHRAGRGPLRRTDGRAARARRPAAAGLPGRCRHRARAEPAVSVPAFVVLEGAILGLDYGLLALGLVLDLPDQPGPQLRPGPARRGGRRVPGQAATTTSASTTGSSLRPGASALAAAMGALSELRPAPPVQPAPGPGHGGHHRPVPGAVPLHRAAVHPAQEAVPALPGAHPPDLHHRQLPLLARATS